MLLHVDSSLKCSRVALAGFARISFAVALGDDNAASAGRVSARVTRHQMFPVVVALLANWSTAVLLAATVAYNSRAA